jgi:tRNA 2-thiocytidine biosynthesis protein TtcA
MQRVAIKKMLADWELAFPGRTETIFSALRNVAPEHLADPRHFDFAGLDAQRAPEMTDDEEVALAARLDCVPAFA